MPEHTPAPTPHRAVYGFALFLSFKTLLVIYLFWAFVPDHILENQLGLTYLPNKYFAIMLPVLVLTGLMFFAFLIYPAWNLSITNDIDDKFTIRDNYSIRRCQFINVSGKLCDRKITFSANDGWATELFCDLHKNGKTGDEDEIVTNNKIKDFCDCSDKSKCMLATHSGHVQMLLKRKTVPCVCDLDISVVCRKLFRQQNLDLS